MITADKSTPYKFVLKDGHEYVGFILVNEPDIESLIALLYSSVKDNQTQKLSDSKEGTRWAAFHYLQLESVEPLNPISVL